MAAWKNGGKLEGCRVSGKGKWIGAVKGEWEAKRRKEGEQVGYQV